MPQPTTPPRDTDSDAPIIPEGAGLPEGRAAPREPARRSGPDLLDAAATGGSVSPAEHDDLVDYFLANGELPGDTRPTSLSVRLGRGPGARKFQCEVKPITWDDWQDARERATDDKTAKFDAFVQSSWVVARSLIKPQLGPTVLRMQRETPDTAPEHAAQLLQRMFTRQSGPLLELAGKVLEISGLQDDAESVREVESAKN